MKLACAAYPLDPFADFAALAEKLTRWVAQAADQGAELLVFPEYGAMELASLGGAAIAADQEAALHEVMRHTSAVQDLHCALAQRFGLHILGASGPAMADGVARPVNRAVLYGPEGVIGHQDKLIMTRFEREDWDIAPGDRARVFDTGLGKLGVLICYDSEFPLLARAMVEQGAEILLVPSTTETIAGYTRVKVGAMARALESQCVSAHAPLVGMAEWCAGVEENHGAAAIYGPPDAGWPDDGVLAQGALDAPGWVMAEVSRAKIAQTRADGVVLGLQHWPEQYDRIKHSPAG